MDPRRSLPAVERVLAGLDGLPHDLLADCARDAVASARARVEAGEAVDAATVTAAARLLVAARRAALLQPAVNATGVLLHTNLGRAPLGQDARAAVDEIARAYSNLEYGLETGERRSRHAHAGALLARACGAEAGIVLNNNAAAVLVALAALARGREVVVSRGELVEIGDGFRVPEVMAESGARLVEVGATNRTYWRDYEAAIGESTALVVKVHASNYRMVGFVESTPVSSLATLGPPVLVDAGSGLLDETTPWLRRRPVWLRDEPGVRQCLEAGASLVTFSGDKLLGGPQAGVVVGTADLVAQVARHPLARATRADKMTLAAMQAVAWSYLDGTAAGLPLWRMATQPAEELRARAERITRRVPGSKVVECDAVAGGGSLPGLTIPSVGVAVEVDDGLEVLAQLRVERVIARTDGDRVVCDLRTVDVEDDDRLAVALRTALG